MKTRAIVGINFGDEGKGRMVDYFAEHADVVVRYQGGNNAGHTVVNEHGSFALHLLPSGICHEGTVNIIGPGVVVNLEALWKEMAEVREKGIAITPENLVISHRATILMPYHQEADRLEEERLGDKKFGSTMRGIAPTYGDKYLKKTLQMGHLFTPEIYADRLKDLVEWKNISRRGLGQPEISYEEMKSWLDTYRELLLPYIKDVYDIYDEASDREFLFEAQLGAMRDPDYGIFPYTTSSSPLAAYAPIGCGYPKLKLDEVLGVMKAYGTCVGEGPYVGELEGEEASRLRELGHEYGASTGRPRRVSYVDVVSSRYGAELQGVDGIILTKLDVLSDYDEIPVMVAYEYKGERLDRFPYTTILDDCTPIYEILPGWKEDISKVRRFQDLPQAARDYILFLEEHLKTPIPYISVGPARDELIVREELL